MRLTGRGNPRTISDSQTHIGTELYLHGTWKSKNYLLQPNLYWYGALLSRDVEIQELSLTAKPILVRSSTFTGRGNPRTISDSQTYIGTELYLRCRGLVFLTAESVLILSSAKPARVRSPALSVLL